VSESTTEHHYADGPPPAAVPPATFQEPQEPDTVRGLTTREVLDREATLARQLPGVEEYARRLADATQRPDDPQFRHLDGSPSQIPKVPAAPSGEVPADPAPAPGGPVPILEGTFAIFLTPDESIVVAYRPRGADADKRFVLPAFIVAMATRQSGHTPTEIFQALKDGAL